MHRRDAGKLIMAAGALGLLGPGGALAADGVELGPAEPFSHEALIQRAKALAADPFKPTPVIAPEVMATIDYDAYQKIAFRPERTLWRNGQAPYPVAFFHPGKFFPEPVPIGVVEGGMARPVLHGRDLFDYGATGLDARLPEDIGFAGFRALYPDRAQSDWIAFLGASYFRSSGPLDQYGMSARGLAIDTAMPDRPEEFPRFVAFWLERTDPDSGVLPVHALLDGPSCAGAYRILCRRDPDVVTTEVEATLFFRRDVARLGAAPLTSMFWYAEHNRRQSTDWRPELHDTDGLALWTGTGERLWRPLSNPPSVRTSSFADKDPKGFGLLQRDRDFDHYQDDGVYYDRRPGVWVEPLEAWGEGAVQLVEIPTDDEIYDNIVAYWTPSTQPKGGESRTLRYRLHWCAEEPFPPSLARVVATRIGRAGIAGQTPRPTEGKKFVIDFEGGGIGDLEQRYDVACVVGTSRGRIDNPYALKVLGTNRWRGFFDLRDVDDAQEPVELRCFLRLDGKPLTETWVFQYLPFAFRPG
ncbi:MAG: glucan biosynthesis protein D [Geminicoccaceae bacterium]|nr:glucan biosynthesis protein D [Geminicoccaceae bacterium]